MFDFLKRKKNPNDAAADSTLNSAEARPNQEEASSQKQGFFSRLKSGLAKTRSQFSSGLANLFLGKKVLNKELIDEIETQLLTADLGVPTTERLIQTLTTKLARKELNDGEAAFKCLQEEMVNILTPCEIPLKITKLDKPYVILMVGVNGSGKTTTIGKLAHHLKSDYSLLLAAGDTFRAAAIEQLTIWSERNNIPVIAQQQGADTAAVIYDALAAATARKIDVLIADTAGRLHTQVNLMTELQKVKRVLAKIDPEAPHEVMIVLDATAGQNALNQVKQFHQAIGITGIVLTKLDGTAKGGIIFSIAEQTKIPIRFIGIGEEKDDLRPFNAKDFVSALFSE